MSILWSIVKIALGIFMVVKLDNLLIKINNRRKNRKKAHLSVVQ